MNAISSTMVAGVVLALTAATSSAQDNAAVEDAAPAYQVAERNEAGQVTKVLLDGRVYDICVQEGQDSCINPRDAGLDFGARELEYWPGKPARSRSRYPPRRRLPKQRRTMPRTRSARPLRI